MGCLMKNGIATYGSLPHDYYVLKINGRANSIYRRYEDALREGLLLRYQFPHDDIKVCEITEEVAIPFFMRHPTTRPRHCLLGTPDDGEFRSILH